MVPPLPRARRNPLSTGSPENHALIAELGRALGLAAAPLPAGDPDPATVQRHVGARLRSLWAFETRLLSEEIARQRLANPAARPALLPLLAIQRLWSETRILQLILRLEAVLNRQLERAANPGLEKENPLERTRAAGE
ncbi:MAG: hypothetical protein ABUS49_08670, partial [Acidobacteriota bacterium]